MIPPVSKSTEPSLVDSISQFIEDPKVKRVAKRVFEALLCIGFGAAMGVLAFAPLGAPLVLIGVGAGAGGGAFAYAVVFSVDYIIKKYGFPSNRYVTAPPISKSKWFEEANLKKFDSAFNKVISKLPTYNAWKAAKGIGSDASAKKKLLKEVQRGTCQGEAQVFIALLKDNSQLSGSNFLSKIEPKKVFIRQMCEVMRSALTLDPEMEKITFNIPHAKPLGGPIAYTKKDLKDPDLFKNTLKPGLIKEHDNQAIAMTIRLEDGDDEAHTLYVEMSPNLRFYDGSSFLYSGLHEGFKSEEHLLKYVQRHIRGYNSNARLGLSFNKVIIRPYLIDLPKVQATAGAVP